MTISKAVVTGAGGFIGSHLAQDLARRGVETVGVDLHFPVASANGQHNNLERIEGDFRDAQTMKRALADADCLFHLASAHLQVNLSDSEYWNVNVHGIPTVLRLAKEAGVKRCVHVSSVGIYGDVAGESADEETPPSPQTIYGQTKLMGEKAAIEFGHDNDFEVVVLRPAWVYGPGCPRMRKLYCALRRRKFLMIGNGMNRRHPIYLQDMLDALHAASKRDGVAGDVFIVAGERTLTTRELVDAVCRAFDLAPPKVQVPLWMGTFMAIGVQSAFAVLNREPPMSRRTLEFFKANNAFKIDKARRDLGYEPKVDFDEGLRRTAQWYIECGMH